MKSGYSILIIISIMIFQAISCEKNCDCDPPPNDCQPVHFNDGLYDIGVRDATTFIEKLEIKDNCLEIIVSFSGGCEEHFLDFAAIGWEKSDPPQVEAAIIHDNQDPCEAILRDTIEFDLFDLKYENNNELVINLEGWDEPILHSYTE